VSKSQWWTVLGALLTVTMPIAPAAAQDRSTVVIADQRLTVTTTAGSGHVARGDPYSRPEWVKELTNHHPHRRFTSRDQALAIALVVIVGGGAAGGYWLQEPTPTAPRAEGRRSAQRDGPAPVTVALVRQQTVPVYRQGIGNVQALYTVTVRAQIDGRLATVDFVEGQNVRKGDVLARIDPVVYQAQYTQAVAKKAQDEATLANALIDLVRYQRLAATNAGPQQQADQQITLVAQLEAQVKADEAAIDNARAYLDYTTIVSPIDGRTGLRQIDPGNVIHAADSNGLVVITQVAPIAMVFSLPQRDLATVGAALARSSVPAEVLQEDDSSAVLARGTLQTIDNQVDATTGTIRLKATFPNQDDKLWPGQFASARVVVETLVDAKVVPSAAIRRSTTGTFVYLVSEENRASVRPVSVLMQEEAYSVIGDGVDIGARVITVGFDQLKDGKPVRIVQDGSTLAMLQFAPEPARTRPEGSERHRRKERDPSKADLNSGAYWHSPSLIRFPLHRAKRDPLTTRREAANNFPYPLRRLPNIHHLKAPVTPPRVLPPLRTSLRFGGLQPAINP
jgi:membrane fusion protein, multidrug efflux system